jgi:DNA-binding winged helix-turn-helix (wHTH) protein/Tol biopolymer transport system component
MLLKTEGLYVFGPYRLDARERQLLRDGVPVPLPPKAFDLLVALVAQAGHLRMKGELLREVWPDTFVEEANLSYTISQLRTALGDNGELHQLIETVPRRGYRFIGPVLLPTVPEAATEELQNRAATARPALAYWMLGVVGVLVLAASLAWLVARPLPPQVTGGRGCCSRHIRAPDWSDAPNECCGSWTPDGKYFVFQATRAGQTHIWALRDRYGPLSSPPSEPVQLTRGPIQFIRPALAPDGRIIALGWQLRGEVVRLDRESGHEVPHLSSLSAEWVSYSRDGQAITYVTYPEADLWRSRSDGSDRLQLTFPPMRAHAPAWSPDGRSIAFVGQVPGGFWKIYLTSAEGGVTRPLTKEDRLEWSPTWSPDGRQLAFTVDDAGIRIFDADSGGESELRDSTEVHEPQWSPDGRYIAAHSRDHGRLMLFDFTTRQWQELTRTEVAQHVWSADGRSLQFRTVPPHTDLYRIRLADKHVEQIGTLRHSRWVFGVIGLWVGYTPDGSPLHLRDQSIHHIYALDWNR